jgi:hypothetical protein
MAKKLLINQLIQKFKNKLISIKLFIVMNIKVK